MGIRGVVFVKESPVRRKKPSVPYEVELYRGVGPGIAAVERSYFDHAAAVGRGGTEKVCLKRRNSQFWSGRRQRVVGRAV